MGPGCHVEPWAERLAARLVTTWMIARCLGSVGRSDGLAEAEEWLYGTARFARSIARELQGQALGELRTLGFESDFCDLLPYVLDPHEPGTRRSVMRRPTDALHREARKRAGVYYTPSDVADFMVATAFREAEKRSLSVLDPACGSGVYLRSALSRLRILGHDAPRALACLHGMDVSLRTVEACAFVVLHDHLCGGGDRVKLPIDVLRSIRERVVAVDSLLVNPPDAEAVELWDPATLIDLDASPEASDRSRAASVPLNELFPSSLDGFDVVVTNPPYARLGRRRDAGAISKRFECLAGGVTPTTNTYQPFVEMMWRFARGTGSSAMVVPLSVAYSSTENCLELRRKIAAAGGQWEFYFFDRTPDALFGDDVKQRVTILARHGGSTYVVKSGPLRRWTSRTRHRLFTDLEPTSLAAWDISGGIPKLDGALEVDAFKLLLKERPRLDEWCPSLSRRATTRLGNGDAIVLVAPTAYNWLSVYRDAETMTAGLARPSASRPSTLLFQSNEEADAAFAVLSSRLVYWLWRVTGDGFHVTAAFLAGLPLSLRAPSACRARLADLGEQLVSALQRDPVRSVNGGRQTLTYCPWAQPELVDDVDRVLLRQLGLPATFGERLRDTVVRMIVVDPNDAKRVKRAESRLTQATL